MHTKRCFQNHMGVWLMNPLWMTQAVSAIRSGMYQASSPKAVAEDQAFHLVDGNIAIIPLHGPLMKGWSKYGGTSTIEARQQIRNAVTDQRVKAILLDIESPGGHVSGTQELASDILAARSTKPVFAQITDLGASAAYWAASQAESIFANQTAEVGSIGTMAIVEDTSKLYEMAGVKVHVVSTGEHKGAFADGTPVTPAMIEDLQKTINGLNQFFLSAVQSGRRIEQDALGAIADGRAFLAHEAMSLGLIDGIQTIEQTIETIRSRLSSESRKARVKAIHDRVAEFRRVGEGE